LWHAFWITLSMKTLFIITAVCFVSLFKGQNVQNFHNFTITPSSPTTTDNIKIITEVGFSSNANAQSIATVQVGNVINLNRCYSMGMLTIYDIKRDTVNVGLLPAGVYTVNYNGVVTNLNNTCSPPGQTFTSSITFTVLSTPSGIKENNSDAVLVSAYPNPLSDDLWIELKNNSDDFGLKVYDNLGNLVYEEANHYSSERIDLSSLATGVYHLKVLPKNSPSKRIIVVKL